MHYTASFFPFFPFSIAVSSFTISLPSCVCAIHIFFMYVCVQVFLMTHLSFTTSRDVLEALINCMKSPCDGSSHMSADAVFTFSMESGTDRLKIHVCI